MHCIDPSQRALDAVARTNLRSEPNCRFHLAGVDDIPLPDDSVDFAYSIGVLHHVPDTAAAIRACASKLKAKAPLLLYLYFAFDNKPREWYAIDICGDLVTFFVAVSRPLPISDPSRRG